MTIVMGAGVGYSPLLYRKRDEWQAIAGFLRKDAIQPKSSGSEDDKVLADYDRRISEGFSAVERALANGALDALILISADRGSQFDSSHVPQIHLQVGGEIWGDPAIRALGELPRQLRFQCDSPIAAPLIEELVRDGFDVAEAKGAFKPIGDPEQGLTPAATEAVARLAGNLPIIPISINCHVTPVMNGRRLHLFGLALSRAAGLTGKRLGILVSGGLSGDPRGRMAGWIDDVFDKWALSRIERSRSADLARVWDVASRTLRGSSTVEMRLWTVAAASLEHSNCRARVIDYMPIHHAAAGIAFVTWENSACL
jgi:Catalytic LigB subunit of aromatic ring-opening dioxygenase